MKKVAQGAELLLASRLWRQPAPGVWFAFPDMIVINPDLLPKRLYVFEEHSTVFR